MPQINGQEVGPVGFGLMGFTWRPQPCATEQAIAVMKAALDLGCNFWNGGEFYGPPEYNSLVLLERYLAQHPDDADRVVLSVKGAGGPHGHQPDGSAAEIRRSLGRCLAQLQGRKRRIDVFECARRDPRADMRETFAAMHEFVDRGQLGGIALSEVRAETIHQAVGLTSVVAVEVELSLWSTEVLTNGVAAACAQYDIPLVAYSPLGRGMLTGHIKSPDDIPADSMLKQSPRFRPENFHVNLELVRQVEALARKKGVTPAQLAINWVRNLAKRPGMPRTIIPIPGATTVERVRENAVLVDLSLDELDEIDATLAKMEIRGARYPAHVPTDT